MESPVHRRLRHHSDSSDLPGNNPANAPLPDIIPGPRDRSVSLPDVQALRRQNEIEMGRELRRISDEFNNFRGPRRQLSTVAENFDRESASFPGARPAYLTNVWSSLRNLLWGSRETVTDADNENVPQGSS